ncbi:hypothetical protein SDC9_194694 [bioreactor metagenome]|uniref:Uncharacterized protein n=1 Tax=bioreactor metagenome TaxID=1076179 RepID=A0A645IFM0_9ZZZZ
MSEKTDFQIADHHSDQIGLALVDGAGMEIGTIIILIDDALNFLTGGFRQIELFRISIQIKRNGCRRHPGFTGDVADGKMR